MALCLRAIVTLLPLILIPYVLLYYDVTPKILVILVGVAIAVLLTVREAPAKSPLLRIFGFLLAAQCAWLAVVTVASKDPALSFGGSAWRRYGLVTQAAVLLLAWIVAQFTAGNSGRIRALLRAMAVGGIPVAVYGILQYFGWDPIIYHSAYHAGFGPLAIVRPPSTMGHASYLATYLLSVIFAGVALVWIDESARWRILAACACLAGTAALILSGTRAAMLALLCGAILLGVWLRPKIRAREVAATVAGLGLLAGFYFSPAGQLLRGRMLWAAGDWFGGGRLMLWRDALRMAAARWYAGFGPETFSVWFPRYQSADLARAFPAFYQESPHNIFLDALADQGVVGAVLFIAVPALGFYAAWKARESKLAKVLASALAALVVSQMFTVFIAATAVFFYITIALLVALASQPVRVPPGGHRAVQWIGAGLVAVLFLAFAMALLFVDRGLGRVNYFAYYGRVPEAVASYRQVERWRPPGVRTDLWYSRAIAGAGRKAANVADASLAWQQGFESAQRAVENAEELENAWLNLAVFYGTRNDFPHTEQALRSAIASAPNSYKPHWLLAQTLWVGGKLQEAEAEAARAADLNGAKDPAVARTLTGIRAALEKLPR